MFLSGLLRAFLAGMLLSAGTPVNPQHEGTLMATETPVDTDQVDTPETPVETPVETVDAPRFSIHPLKAGKSTLYDDAVESLIDAQQHADEVMAITILVPGDKKGKAKHLRDFREAATRHEKTARIRNEDEQVDGSIAIDFTLTDRVTRQRNAAPRSAGASAASA